MNIDDFPNLKAFDVSIDENHMATWQSGMLRATDTHEAMKASKEKRDPKFDNLLP